VRRFERGECSAADFAAEVVAEFGARVTPERFLVEFTGWPKGFYPEARTLLGALKEKYRLACLSNSNAVHWERFDAFSGVFDVALSSHLLGVIKPDREAFLRALDECAVEAHEVWFFDDALSNVEAAESVGMRAFHVDGFEALKETLVREGII
jgi:putative hydrolase of the HAD superfamily